MYLRQIVWSFFLIVLCIHDLLYYIRNNCYLKFYKRLYLHLVSTYIYFNIRIHEKLTGYAITKKRRSNLCTFVYKSILHCSCIWAKRLNINEIYRWNYIAFVLFYCYFMFSLNEYLMSKCKKNGCFCSVLLCDWKSELNVFGEIKNKHWI